MLKNNELRIGNLVKWYDVSKVLELHSEKNKFDNVYIECEESFEWTEYNKLEPIPLTEEWLLKFGFSVINESSAGKRYGYVINGVFNSGLTFTFWKTTKEVGKFFRGDLELKSVHQLQNLYFALTGAELTVAKVFLKTLQDDNESMNFHECSECNIRCNCTTSECSCSCRTES